jgi:WD repeat-containing protein 19
LALATLDFAAASALAEATQDPETWVTIAQRALDAMDLSTAIHAFQQVGDVSKVMALQQLTHIEDRHLLAGHILALSEASADDAEKMLLAGQDTTTALQLRQDMRQWQKAIDIANVHDPSCCGSLLVQNAAMLEMQGEIGNALHAYQVRAGPCPSSYA